MTFDPFITSKKWNVILVKIKNYGDSKMRFLLRIGVLFSPFKSIYLVLRKRSALKMEKSAQKVARVSTYRLPERLKSTFVFFFAPQDSSGLFRLKKNLLILRVRLPTNCMQATVIAIG